jgi:hypothetical protein
VKVGLRLHDDDDPDATVEAPQQITQQGQREGRRCRRGRELQPQGAEGLAGAEGTERDAQARRAKAGSRASPPAGEQPEDIDGKPERAQVVQPRPQGLVQGMGDADQMSLGEGLSAPGQKAGDSARMQQELRAPRRAGISPECAQLLATGFGKLGDQDLRDRRGRRVFPPPLIGLAAGCKSSRSLSAPPLSGVFAAFAFAPPFAFLLAFFTGLSFA